MSVISGLRLQICRPADATAADRQMSCCPAPSTLWADRPNAQRHVYHEDAMVIRIDHPYPCASYCFGRAGASVCAHPTTTALISPLDGGAWELLPLCDTHLHEVDDRARPIARPVGGTPRHGDSAADLLRTVQYGGAADLLRALQPAGALRAGAFLPPAVDRPVPGGA